MKKTINKYHSIFVAIEYKNKFEVLLNELNKSKLNTEYGFKQNLPEFFPFGIRSLKINNSNKIEGQLFIALNKISYEATNMDEHAVDDTSIIIKEAEKIFKEIFKEEFELKFVGCILRKEYVFENDELKQILKVHFPKGVADKKIEIKLNFHNSDKLNYNIWFDINVEKEILLASIDINTTYVDDKSRYKMKDIIVKVKEYMEDTKKLLDLLIRNEEENNKQN